VNLGGRTKRTVEYKVERDIADYTNGTVRLPGELEHPGATRAQLTG
jgi:hypothetical protein